MKNKALLILCLSLPVLLAAVAGAVWWRLDSQTPQALLKALAAGKGDRQDLIMRLNVSRGEVVAAMIQALQDRSAPAAFRAEVLELLMRRNFRSRQERIEQAVRAALHDGEPLVRRRAAYDLAIYARPELQTALTDCVNDSDSETRRNAYMVLARNTDYSYPLQGWEHLQAEQRSKLVEDCLRQARQETDPEMVLLARSVVAREVSIRNYLANQALQTSDQAKAEEILLGALKLDSENAEGQIHLVRFYLKTGQTEKAVELARQFGALLEIPQLPQEPVIDGDPTDLAWQSALRIDKFYNVTSRWVARPAKGRSTALVGHRDGKIYIAMIGYEDDLGQLVRKTTTRDGKVYEDDCVELLFNPDSGEKDFYQFVINSADGLFDRFNRDFSKNFNCRYKSAVFNDRGYWACEFVLDGKDLDKHPIQPGTMWSMDLVRTRIGPASEMCGIWPTYGATVRPELYPLAVFK